jgi:uncharacterized membrane protein YccC
MNTLTLVASDLVHGHLLLSDWLLLIAAILFFIAAVVIAVTTDKPWLSWSGLVAVGLAATAIGLLVI